MAYLQPMDFIENSFVQKLWCALRGEVTMILVIILKSINMSWVSPRAYRLQGEEGM